MGAMGPALLIAALAAAAPLFAIGSETWWGLAPCALCLWQRWPYWVAALVTAAIGGLHVGVEQGWWPSPLPGCQAPTAAGGGTIDDMMRGLAAAPSKPCDAATYLIPGLPLSMAAMNLFYGLGLGVLALALARRQVRGS